MNSHKFDSDLILLNYIVYDFMNYIEKYSKENITYTKRL